MPFVSRVTSDRDVRELLQPESVDDSSTTPKRTRLAQSVIAFRIASVLQTTMDINQMLVLFGQQVLSTIHQIGLRYVNTESAIDISIGQTDSQHEFSHQLVASNSPLGSIKFYRDSAFSKAETVFLEYALCGLLFPLRNVLLYAQAINLARKDPLTGLNNRACLDDDLRREIELARRRNDTLSLLVIDIDHFKRINDAYGHSVGDFAIQAVSGTVRECLRSSDMLYRWGGEEFVVILSNTDTVGAMQVAERIRAAIAQTTFRHGQGTLTATVSIGVTTLLSEDNEISLFQRADSALLHAKAEGRNQVRQSAANNEVAAA